MTPIPTEQPLVVAAGVIAVLTLGVGLGTLLTAVWLNWQQARRETVRDQVKEQLLERLFGADPAWEQWVAELSGVEKRELRTLLEMYLRQLRGTEHDSLCSLARELGIQSEAKRNIRRGHRKVRALTWLALLAEPVDVAQLRRHCTDTARERAAAARVLYESDAVDADDVGTELLIWEGDQPLTEFGLDTLYHLNDGVGTPLLSVYPAAIEDWEQHLLIQSLLVLRHASIETPGDRLDWLPALLTHDSPEIRAAVVGVTERHGWRDRLRSRIDIDRLLQDPDPSARADTYLLLASWGDEQSARQLAGAVESAFDQLLLAAVRALHMHPQGTVLEPTGRIQPVVAWVRADAAVSGSRVWGIDSWA